MVRAMAAPIAHLDDEQPGPADDATGLCEGELPLSEPADGRCSPGLTGGFGSAEDPAEPAGSFPACVGGAEGEADSLGAVESLLEKDQIWSALTSSYAQVMPVDWKRSRTRSLYISTFNLEERKRDVAAELSDEEELREQLDMHSIIVPCLEEEPLVTAEQVIEEIEEMMQDSPDVDAEHNPSQSDLSMLSLSLDIQLSSPGFEDRLRALSAAELSEHLREAEVNIRRFSEELVQQLAIRDELDFEKEVKNSFISALIDVQNRQKEHRESLKKKKKLKGGAATGPGVTEKTPASRFSMEGISSVIQNSFRQTFGSGCSERQYLTTVIPYEKKGHPPSVEDLQILTKILQAMRDDSDKVPGLLTDYILNVFCPT
ncbi:LOW QUALITY PROTEIN: fasciculation and elongation protein zeta-2 [Kryptolebias marmoratus]|uniref:LOW QUALITY PROTEIN: fasciculation and elongation protein zeta-2 n=1 Tax=Kryptolebias marmoratus TaxID=37003 RepID=UPI0018AD0B40|nr:LOW QUALITY PROTEIN: fasciculation and elongation protein zeta-2 [Kryptolebias marmoratus]